MLRGASVDTCQNVNQFEPLRTYRATIPNANVASGTYTVSGIGGGGIVTHGASLVVVYRVPNPTSVTPKTKVYVRDGACRFRTNSASRAAWTWRAGLLVDVFAERRVGEFL